MGGALAVHAATRNYFPSLIGLTVIDVVEGKNFYRLIDYEVATFDLFLGSAMEALQSMQNVLRSRPEKFLSQEQAIEWW